jgi:hypothetical protein
VSPIAYKIVFLTPAANSSWKLLQTVPIKVALVDDKGARVTDARAAELLAIPCRVTFSASGAQTRAASCMKYDAVNNRFFFNWALGATGIGTATIKITIAYGSPSKVETISTRTIKIIP